MLRLLLLYYYAAETPTATRPLQVTPPTHPPSPPAQVEHPVTEQITGVDLVEQMIRIAEGHALPENLRSDKAPVAWKGWALEARVYAEDPLRGFLPSTGPLVSYVEPEQSDSVRVDSGVEAGASISTCVTLWGPTAALLFTATTPAPVPHHHHQLGTTTR